MDNKIGFFRSYGQFWMKSFDFKSRTPRREFWFAILANILVYIVSVLVFCVLGAFGIVFFDIDTADSTDIAVSIAVSVYPVVTLISSLALWTRRAHDSGKKGYLIIPSFIAYSVSSTAFTVSSLIFIFAGFISLFSSEAAPTAAGGFIAMIVSGIISVLSLVYLAIVAFSDSAPDNEFGPNPYGQK